MTDEEKETTYDSPLGKDPEELDSEVPSGGEGSEEDRKKEESKEENSVTLTKEEHDNILEKAKNYETMLGDPHVESFLRNYYTKLAAQSHFGGAGTPNLNTDSDEEEESGGGGSQGQVEERISKLEGTLNDGAKMLQAIQTGMGRMMVEMFNMRHPDAKQYEAEMNQILSKAPGLGLEGAYEFAKSRKAASASSSDGSGEEKPASPATEGGAGSPPPSGDALSEFEKRITNRKATPAFDQAVDMAIAAARRSQEG